MQGPNLSFNKIAFTSKPNPPQTQKNEASKPSDKMNEAKKLLEKGARERDCAHLIQAQLKFDTAYWTAQEPELKASAAEGWADAGVMLNQPGAEKQYELAAQHYDEIGNSEKAQAVRKKIKKTPKKLKIWH